MFHVIRQEFNTPPRSFLRIWRTHRKDDDTSEFDFILDLVETLLTGWEGTPLTRDWRVTEVVKDGDQTPAYRGSRLPAREYKVADLQELTVSAENIDTEAGTVDENESPVALTGMDDLKVWCDRCGNDPTPVRS